MPHAAVFLKAIILNKVCRVKVSMMIKGGLGPEYCLGGVS